MAENDYKTSTLEEQLGFTTTSTLDNALYLNPPQNQKAKYAPNLFTKAASILGITGMLAYQAPPISNVYAQQQPANVIQIDPINGPFYDPQLTGILAPNADGDNNPNNDFGFLAFNVAGFRNGERQGTVRMQPGTYNVRFWRPTLQAENAMRRFGLDFADYVSTIQQIMNAYAAQTNGQIIFNPPIFDSAVLTNGRTIDRGGQINPNEINIGILSEGEGPFRGENVAVAINSSFFPNNSSNIITGGLNVYNASRITNENVLRIVASEEIAEGVFFRSDDLNIPSPVDNPETVFVFDPIPSGLLNPPHPKQIDLEVTRLIYAFPPGTTLEEITTSTNNLQPIEAVTTSTIPPTQ